jgi:CBS domain-containing protein
MQRRKLPQALPSAIRELELDGATALDIGSRDVVSVGPDEPLFAALDRMLAEDIEHLPVLQDGRLVGICTRTDILRARQRQMEHERLQPGWRSPLKRRVPH